MNRPAFSLLELVVIVAIIATAAAIATPRYINALTNYRAEGAGRRIIADLELARETARSTSAAVTVTFNVAGNRYTIPGVASLDKPGHDAIVDLADEPYTARLDAADFGGDAVVIFDGYGIPDSGGTVTVTCGGSTKIVTLDLTTGVSTVQAAP